MQTEQKTALEAYAHLMLEHVSLGMALFEAHEMRLLAANPCYQSLLEPQWQYGRAIGHALTEFVPSAEHARITELFRRVVKTGVSNRMEAYASPTYAGDMSYWNWTLDPICKQGQICYVLLTVTEVTSQVVARQIAEEAHTALTQTHHAIADEQQRLHTVLDQLPEGIVLVEARTGKVRYANPAAADLLGYALPHLVGAPLNQSALLSPYGLSSQHQQSAFRWNFALIDALWGKTVTNQEIMVPRPNGSEIVVLSSVAPIRTSHGLITEAVMVFQDITALKQLEQQKNEFFAVANHELRTPLTSILGFTELLQTHATEHADAMQQDAITSIVQECNHLRRLMHELLDVSRLEHARLDLKRCYHDLLAPLTQIVTKHSRTTSTHRLHFTVEDLESTEHLMGWFDLLRIEQVVNNLLSNAVKYSPVGSKIELGVCPHRNSQGTPQEVIIWVKDQGIGIAVRDLPHIFERFYRAATFDGSSISGFGIGLYLTKELVQDHGGRIWAESTLGQGSTFFVALPLGETTSFHGTFQQQL